MKKLLIFLGFIIPSIINAQVAVTTDATAPDNSAMLDVKSINKGMLIPRLTTSQRTTSIASPADGLLVYDTDTKSIWMYKTGTSPGWKELKTNDKVAFKAYSNADQLFTTATNLALQVEEFDDGNNFSPGPFGSFTAPSDGVYHFDYNLAAVNAGVVFQVSLYKTSGVTTSRVHTHLVRPFSTGFEISTCISYTLKLLAGDVIRPWVEPNVGNVTAKGTVTDRETYFSGFKVH